MGKEATQFKPGQSGNPKGRPSKTLRKITELINEELTDEDIKKIIRKIAEKAQAGDVRHAKELLDRYYGQTQPASKEEDERPYEKTEFVDEPEI